MDKKQTVIVIALAVLLAVVVSLIVLLMPEKVENHGFVPPEHDVNAKAGTLKDPDEKLNYQELDAYGSYRVGSYTVALLKDGRIYLDFTSPSTNTVDLKFKVTDNDGNLLAESGMIHPGEYVESIEALFIPEEPCEINVKVISYKAETYESAGTTTLNLGMNIDGWVYTGPVDTTSNEPAEETVAETTVDLAANEDE